MHATHLARTVVFGVLTLAAAAHAGDGFDWITVGDPGNAGYRHPFNTVEEVGGVGYTYRIMRTQVSYGQWAQFANAYAPFFREGELRHKLTGPYMAYGHESGQYFAEERAMNWGAQASFEYVARYCNWLHNGRVNEAWAFEGGAYDMSSGVPMRQADAKYWIPSLDEWVKAAHYDPNRYGEGRGGYWEYLTMNDGPLTYGPSGSGADAIGDWLTYQGYSGPRGEWDLGQYPHAASAYGMLDAAGATAEWTSTWVPDGSGIPSYTELWIQGSWAHDGMSPLWEDLWLSSTTSPHNIMGFRLATSVPSPGAAVVLAGVLGLMANPRR